MKVVFDTKAKYIIFHPKYLVLRWDGSREYKGKHGKFDPLWFYPFKIAESRENSTFVLENMDGEVIQLPING